MKLPDISSILLLGTEDVVALPAIRAIGTALPHTTIHTLSSASDDVQISNYSKYVSRHHTLNSSTGEKLLQELMIQIKETKSEILLPVDEDSAWFISKYRDILKTLVKLPPLPSVNLLDSVVRKDSLADLLKVNGYPTPETYHMKELNPSTLPEDFFPCLMKPIRGSGGIGFKKIDHLSALDKYLSNVKYDNYILQKLIFGSDMDCSILAADGEIKAYTIQRGLQKNGYSFSKAIRFENNKMLYAQVERFIQDIGYSGLAHLDYRFDKRDGLPKLIDFNARFWTTMEGSKAAGVDFTLLNCLEALNIPYKKPIFIHCNYLLGRGVYNRFSKSLNRQLPTFTDLKSRITDPIPELLRVL